MILFVKFSLFSLDYVIIPVHLGMHWVCAVLDIKRKVIEYFDSLHGSGGPVVEVRLIDFFFVFYVLSLIFLLYMKFRSMWSHQPN